MEEKGLRIWQFKGRKEATKKVEPAAKEDLVKSKQD